MPPRSRRTRRAELLANAGAGANYANRFEEALALYEASLACSRDAGLAPVAVGLAQLGIAELESNRPGTAISRCEEAVAAARTIGDRFWELFSLGNLSLACSFGGDDERGRRVADELMTAARRLGNRFLIGTALLDGGIARITSEPEVAIELLEECVRVAPSSTTLGQSYFFRGVAHLRLGQPAEAARALREALPHMQETGSDFFTATVIGTVSGVVARRAPGTAAELLAALDRFRVESGIEGAPGDVEVQRRTRAHLEASMDPAELAAAWARGAVLSIEEATTLARAELTELER